MNCSSFPSLLIKATQLSCDNPKCPLIPPNKYTYFDRKTIVINKVEDDAHWMYNAYKSMSNNKKRGYVDGATYTDIFSSAAKVIDVSNHKNILL